MWACCVSVLVVTYPLHVRTLRVPTCVYMFCHSMGLGVYIVKRTCIHTPTLFPLARTHACIKIIRNFHACIQIIRDVYAFIYYSCTYSNVHIRTLSLSHTHTHTSIHLSIIFPPRALLEQQKKGRQLGPSVAAASVAASVAASIAVTPAVPRGVCMCAQACVP
jgi:hypothetical protein